MGNDDSGFLGVLWMCSVLLNLPVPLKRCEILMSHTFPVPQGEETVDSWFKETQGFGAAARKTSLYVTAIQ